MPPGNLDRPLDLPPAVSRVLDGFVEAARGGLGADLRAVVLFGSAAEGRLRATSDVNVVVVLRAFDAGKMDGLRDTARTAHAAIKLEPMFLLEGEIPAATQAFAVKFADVLRRRRILFGDDPFAGVTMPRGAEVLRLRQVLLNLALRLRQRYVLGSLREEQATLAVAEAAGPLRSCAAALLELRGTPAPSPKEALASIAASLPGGPWSEVLGHLSRARERRSLPAGAAGPTLLRLADLATLLRAEAERLQ